LIRVRFADISGMVVSSSGRRICQIESFLAICRAFDKKPSEVLASIDF